MLRKGLKGPWFHPENYKVLKQDDVFTLIIATESIITLSIYKLT